MEDWIDRIIAFVTDLPIGLIVFLLAIAFSFFGGDRKQAPGPAGAPDGSPRQEDAPRPVLTEGGPFGRRGEERPHRQPRSQGQHTFASDERRAREERERREEEVLIFGGLDFGSRGSLFRDEGDRDSQWGKTKYGFDDSEWGSAFGDKKSSEPIIR